MFKEFGWFLLLILFLFLGWIATGGPERNELNRTHPFLKQPTTQGDDGTVYTYDQIQKR